MGTAISEGIGTLKPQPNACRREGMVIGSAMPLR